MSVFRIKPQSDFSILSNAALQDPSLSIEAIGLWSYCMSLPSDWEFHVSQLANRFNIGKHKVYKIIKELIEKRYVFKGQKMEFREGTKAGKRKLYAGVEYIFFGKRITDEQLEALQKDYHNPEVEIKKMFPLSDFCDAENLDVEKRSLQRTKEETKKHMLERNIPPSPKIPKKKEAAPKQEEKRKEESKVIKKPTANYKLIDENRALCDQVLMQPEHKKFTREGRAKMFEYFVEFPDIPEGRYYYDSPGFKNCLESALHKIKTLDYVSIHGMIESALIEDHEV